MTEEPAFTLGIEEEYLLVDAESGQLTDAPDALMAACKAELHDQVSPEFLRCQIEVGTPVANDITEARAHLGRLRSTIARQAREFGLAPISAACHPQADWRDQDHTDKERYNRLSQEMRGMARRMLICGMHVHVGIEDRAQRIDLMNQFRYFLPHLLALSASSPFWQGDDTGLASYRTTVFSGYPRTGLPPDIVDWNAFERATAVLEDLGIIRDSSEIWWDLRPSARFPTLETRVCDACPRLSDTITLAALIQSTLRMLWRLSQRNMRWRQYDNFLIGENRWRALRHGLGQGLIDFGGGDIKPHAQIAEEWLALIAEDADHLGSQPSVARLRDINAQGNSADRQRAVFAAATSAGASRDEAHRAVVMHLIREFSEGLD
ncbi:carboxylate-amine ligase [Paracoccus litorisediminis]|uniref:Putative glutamate--cysteine ligase 2 n=1 Tax=Paracoccus litorisediminis TaxID=2006130 RepID=A0A844HP91_9RHOB|nr:carboxylate-amine ligase [Paracoccus litorisediminis]MTH60224.1 carboxylate-amine ligase [Paracoccus litorisediminis]